MKLGKKNIQIVESSACASGRNGPLSSDKCFMEEPLDSCHKGSTATLIQMVAYRAGRYHPMIHGAFELFMAIP